MLWKSLLRALGYSAALLAWLQWFFLRPLAGEAAAMHERQLDPTEIIDIPYDGKRLVVFVSVVVVAASFCTGCNKMFLPWMQSAAAMFVVCIVAGASPYRDLLHTLLAAIYLSTLCWFAPPIFPYQQDHNSAVDTADLFELIRHRVSLSSARNQYSVLAATTTQATIGCTIPFPILLLYDRGWQAQRWPVPIILGSTIGWSLGVLLGTALAFRTGFLDGLSKKEEPQTAADR